MAHNRHTWRALFWLAAGFTTAAALLRLILPESEIFLRAQRKKKELNAKLQEEGSYGEKAIMPQKSKTQIFIREIWAMLKGHWKLCIYAFLLMTGFNFLSHGSQGENFPSRDSSLCGR